METTALAGWDNFYVIVGSSAGGLTGLTFVVIALIRDASAVRPTGLRAFVTPTILHFCGVLALASFLSMPHQGVFSLSAGFTLGGLAGVIYGLFTAANMRRQSAGYVPDREDWVWNVILPTLVYACLFCMACWSGTARSRPCLASRRCRCSCCSSGFIMPGTSRSG